MRGTLRPSGPPAGRSDLVATVGLTTGSEIAVEGEVATAGQRSAGSYPVVKLVTELKFIEPQEGSHFALFT